MCIYTHIGSMYVCMCIGYNVINRKILRSLEGGKKDTCCTQYELKKMCLWLAFLLWLERIH